MRTSRFFPVLLLALTSTVTSSCEDTLVQATGDIVVTMLATGAELDLDYAAFVSGQQPQPVRPDLTARFVDLKPGNYSVRLDEAADNCAVSGDNPRSATVLAGTITTVTFAVICVATRGAISLALTTTGVELDQDGYQVLLDGQPRGFVPANGVTIFEVARGTYALSLDALAPNCTMTNPAPRSVVVVAAEITPVTFAVTCVATKGSIRILSTTTGFDLDQDGYQLRLDDHTHGSIPANGSTTIIGVPKGPHTVKLDAVAKNCTLAGANPRSVTIEPDSTTDVLYTVTCRGLANIRVTAASSGIDLDPNGYRVTITGSEFQADSSLGVNSTSVFSQLVDGDYAITLGGLAANCDADHPNPRSVTAPSGDTVAVVFAVACLPVTQLAFVNGDGTIAIVNSNGTAMRTLTDHPTFDHDPAWSPGGRRIAFASRGNSDAEASLEIYVINADGSGTIQLTNSSRSYQPAWSPDGTRIAFVSERDGNAEIYAMNADGSNVVRLTHDPAADTGPAWSHDGMRIAFARDGETNGGLKVINANGSGLTQLTTSAGDRQPEWSPDGTKLTFVRVQCTPYGCYPTILLAQADAMAPTLLVTGDHPTWSSDGRTIAYTWMACDYYYYYYFQCYPAGIGMVRSNGSNVDLAVPGAGFYPAWRQ